MKKGKLLINVWGKDLSNCSYAWVQSVSVYPDRGVIVITRYSDEQDWDLKYPEDIWNENPEVESDTIYLKHTEYNLPENFSHVDIGVMK